MGLSEQHSQILANNEAILENVQKVYEKGRAAGMAESDAATAYATGKAEGIIEGKQAEYDAFWDVYQNYGSEVGVVYNNAFSYRKFNDDTYNPKYPLYIQDGTTTASQMFYDCGLSDTKVPIYCKARQLSQTFNMNSGNLITITYLELLPTTTFYIPFMGCNSLENITIGGTIGQNGLSFQWSPNLSKASITSIINALSTTTSGLSITLLASAVTKAFGSTTADEWTALIATRPNWTISLV